MESEKKFGLLKETNTLLAYGSLFLNSNETDDEDFEFAEKLMNSKVKDVGNSFAEFFNGMINDMPEEMKNITVRELMQMAINNEEFDE